MNPNCLTAAAGLTAAALLSAAALTAQRLPQSADNTLDPANSRAHYQRVERELLAHPPAGLTAAQQAARREALEILRQYREAGAFGRWDGDDTGRQVPMFVDDGGRRCAVAELMWHTGMREAVEGVADSHNGVWVPELEHDEPFREWLEQRGLTFIEAARIQYPGTRPPSDVPAPPPEDPGSGLPTMRPVSGANPATGGGSPSPASGGPAAGPMTGNPGTPSMPATPAGPSTGRGGVPLPPAPSWTDWWRWEKPTQQVGLARNWRSLAAQNDSSGDDVFNQTSGRVDWRERAQNAARELLRKSIGDSSVQIRRAAVRGLGRIAQPEDVPLLAARLQDADRTVRYQAIMALGAAGHSTRAVHQLLALSSDPERLREIGAYAPAALGIALGLATAHNDSPTVRHALGASLESTTSRKDADARERIAAFVGAELAGLDLADIALQAMRDNDRKDVHARAILAVDFADAKARRMILEALSGGDRDMRRAAAWSLARNTGDDLSRASLTSAFEFEAGLLGRQVHLVGIGEHAGPQVRSLLLEEVRDGRKPLRAWAALGLGLWLREQSAAGAAPDLLAERMLVHGFEKEKNGAHQPAFLIALGLGRCTGARDRLLRELEHGETATVRAAAAEALTYLGPADARTREVLTDRMKNDSCPATRMLLAESLALCGQPEDMRLVFEAAFEAPDASSTAQILRALGARGGRELSELFLTTASDTDDFTVIERAALLDGLATATDDDAGWNVASAATEADFATFPTWLQWLLSTSL